MSMGGIFPPMPITQAHAHLDRLLGHLHPERPRWVSLLMAVTGLAAAGADLYVHRHLSRPIPDDGGTERIIALYREEAERLRRERVVVASPTPSRYLASEGADDVTGVEEGCVPCALGHLGAVQGMLERAAEAAAEEGRCGPKCQAWLVPAIREPLALLRHDWTPDRIARTPPEQQAAIRAHLDRVRALKDRLLHLGTPDRSEVREAILGASSSVLEATRFTDAGDPLDHPMVRRRLEAAEPDLLAGERRGATDLPAELKSAIRAVRQDLLNRTVTPEDLRGLAARLEEIDRALVGPAAERMTPEAVRELAQQAAELRRSFKAAVAQAAEPVQRQIAAAAGAGGEAA
jgi:hypothetical protein